MIALGVVIAAAGFFSSGKAVRAESTSILSVRTGQSIIISATDITRVAVGDARIAGVRPVGTSQIVVNGKLPGHTTIIVWSSGGRRQFFELTVAQQTLDDIARLLRVAINEPNVQTFVVSDNLIVRGTVADDVAFGHVADMIARFDKPGTGAVTGKFVNAVTLVNPFGPAQTEINAMPGAHSIHIERDDKDNALIVTGRVRDRATAEKVLDRVRQLAYPFLAYSAGAAGGAGTTAVGPGSALSAARTPDTYAQARVIDRLAVETVSQVDIKVYVLEIDRTGLSQLGARLQSAEPDPNNPNVLIYGDPTNFHVTENARAFIPGRAFQVGSFFRSTRLSPTIDLLVNNGHAHILTSPDLVTLPGEEAKFLVGGEIPYAIVSSNVVNIVFKEYGVRMKFIPRILPNGSVSTQIMQEVSDLDFANGITITGFTVPALKTSRVETNVVTAGGEGIVMGGLLRRIEERNLSKIPGLSELPILGKLFRSTRYKNSETDIVFVVTPEILTQ